MRRSYSKGLLETAAGKRPPTDLEKCMLLILKSKNNCSSEQVLKLAKKLKICASCSDRSEVFYTGEKLLKFGLVYRDFESGEYFWGLTKEGKLFLKNI